LSQGYTYSGSNDPEEVAWYSGNSSNAAHPVKQLAPNELGIYDMSGNVAEYTTTLGQGKYWYDGYGVTFLNYMFCGGSYLSANCKILEESLPKQQGDDMTKLDYVGFRLILTTN
jgi:formylglycine-generating enzyme required for sulfatase activity